jgi:hypothetical protein
MARKHVFHTVPKRKRANKQL